MIERVRLLQRIASPKSGRTLIVAGTGFGKSVLLTQLCQQETNTLLVSPSLDRDADEARSIVPAIAAAVERGGNAATAAELIASAADPGAVARVLDRSEYRLVFDEIHRLDPQSGQQLSAIAGAGNFGLVLAGRRVPIGFERLASNPTWRRYDASDLSMDLHEIREQLEAAGISDSAVVEVIQILTHGWPVALSVVTSQLQGSADKAVVARQLAGQNLVIDRLVQRCLDELPSQDVATSRVLAQLPFFDTQLADAFGSPGILDRLADAGLAFTSTTDGWTKLAAVFKAPLARGLPSKIPSTIIDYFVERNEVIAAIDACLTVGDREAAAAVISGLSLTEQTQLEPSGLNAAMTVIGRAAESSPRSLLVQAQVNASFGRTHETIPLLERAAKAAGGIDAAPRNYEHLDILIELAKWRALLGQGDEAIRLLRRFTAEIPPEDLALQARVCDIEGVVHHNLGTREDLEEAVRLFTDGIALWRQAGEERDMAAAVFRLVEALAGLGQRPQALEVLDDLAATGSLTMLNQARVAVERAALLPFVGRAAEVPDVLRPAMDLAHTLGHDWVIGWALGVEIVAASFLGDSSRVESLASDFDEGGYFIVSDFSQGLMLCQMSEAHARCRQFERAGELLELARPVAALPDWYFGYYEASLAARSGNINNAQEALAALRLRDDVEREKLWAIELLLAYCHAAAGNQLASDLHLKTAFDEAKDLGQPDLPAIVESQLLERITGDGQPSTRSTPPTRIQLFNRFDVSRSGSTLELPNGNPSNLVKIVVLGGGQITLDQAIDQLWPDTDLETGRKRLRNVLYRLRNHGGDIVERDGETLRLGRGVSSDYAEALSAAAAARDPTANDEWLATTVAALDTPLLPDDRYEDWAQEARDHMTKLLIHVLDNQSVVAQERGDTDTAVAALERAHQLDVFDRHRITRAAGLLRAAGRHAAADALELRS